MYGTEHITWILAPMDGVTDYCYRNAWIEVFGPYAGMKRAVSPFVTLVPGRTVRHSHLEDLWPEHNRMEVEPQILGKEAAYFPAMAESLARMGYASVNWNLGCPMRQVASKQRGSGLLPFPDKITEFLDAVLPGSPVRLSVKIRLGYYDKREVYPVIEVLNRYPLDYVAVHPRTGKELYGGSADWEMFGEVHALLKHPCIYNGDINTLEKAQAFCHAFPDISTVMIGRGVIADPFLPCVLSGTSFSLAEKQELFVRFMVALWRNYTNSNLPATAVLQRQKLFWSKFSGDFVPENAFEKIKYAGCMAEYEAICHSFFGELWMEEVRATSFVSPRKVD